MPVNKSAMQTAKSGRYRFGKVHARLRFLYLRFLIEVGLEYYRLSPSRGRFDIV
jgi:hypothetical protein